MDNLLEDKPTSRRFLLAFLIIAVVGGVIAFVTARNEPAITIRSGASVLEVKNLTPFDIRIKGDISMYYGSSARIYFVIPPFTSRELRHHEGDIARIGSAGSRINVRISMTADDVNQIFFETTFDGVEVDEQVQNIVLKKRWGFKGWILIFEELEDEEGV